MKSKVVPDNFIWFRKRLNNTFEVFSVARSLNMERLTQLSKKLFKEKSRDDDPKDFFPGSDLNHEIMSVGIFSYHYLKI